MQIKDMTEQDTITLRKTVYLTFQSSATFEECVHKILKMNIKVSELLQKNMSTLLSICRVWLPLFFVSLPFG